MSSQIETEIKLSLAPDAARKLAKSKHFNALRKGRRKKRRLVSIYFDTPRHLLRKSGIALSVRDDGKHRVQVINVPSPGPLGLLSYRELSAPFEGERPTLDALEKSSLPPSLRRRSGIERLKPVFTTDIDQTSQRLKQRGVEFEVAIDSGVIRAGEDGNPREQPVCEVKFELVSGNPARMLDVALEVCEAYDVRLEHRTKAERGYVVARPALRPRPFKAANLALPAEMTAGQAFRAIIRDTLDHLFRNQPPTLHGHPEGVHQTRVAMRRLRAALRAFKTLLPYDKRKAFNGEFRWFQQRLAPARDWHVFLAETLPLLTKYAPNAETDLRKLRRIAGDERRRATREAVGILESRRYTRLILQFERWLAYLEEEIPAKSFDRPISPFARSVLRKTRRDLLQERRALSRLPAEDLHELRKRGKKARYATEFFSTFWTGGTIKPYLKNMKKIQDRLGEANDAIVARHILWTVRPERLEPTMVQLVQDWSQAGVHDCVISAQPHWRRFRQAKPFWEG